MSSKGTPVKAIVSQSADSDDDWDMGRGKGNSKGKKKGGGGCGGGANAKAKKGAGPATGKATTANSTAGRGAPPSGPDLSARLLSNKAIAAKLVEWYPELEEAAHGLSTELASRLRPAALTEYERALSAVFAAGTERRRRQREVIARALEEAWQKLQLYSHGAEVTTFDRTCRIFLMADLPCLSCMHV